MAELTRSYDCLVSIMGFSILVIWHLYIEAGPRFLMRRFDACKRYQNMFFSLSGCKNVFDISLQLKTSSYRRRCYLYVKFCSCSHALRQRSCGPTLAHVMACRLAAPSHYLNLCWVLSVLYSIACLKIKLLKSMRHFCRVKEWKSQWWA